MRHLNRSELAKELNVNLSTVDSWIRKGCPCRKRDRQWQFDLEEVERWRYVHQGYDGKESFLIREMSAKIIGDFFTWLINDAAAAWGGMVKEIGINDTKFIKKLYVLTYVIMKFSVDQVLKDQLRQTTPLEIPEIIIRTLEEDKSIKAAVVKFCQGMK
jgi:hypothetical protein